MFSCQQMSVELFAGQNGAAERIRKEQHFVGAFGNGALKEIVRRRDGGEQGICICRFFKAFPRKDGIIWFFGGVKTGQTVNVEQLVKPSPVLVGSITFFVEECKVAGKVVDSAIEFCLIHGRSV